MQLILASWNFNQAQTWADAAKDFVTNRNILLSGTSRHWDDFSEWVENPHIYSTLIAWVVTFTAVYILLSCIGFTPHGIAAGSIAAGFQAWAYGGFTPAGGIFATLTSIGMLGLAQPLFLILAITVASFAASLVYVALKP